MTCRGTGKCVVDVGWCEEDYGAWGAKHPSWFCCPASWLLCLNKNLTLFTVDQVSRCVSQGAPGTAGIRGGEDDVSGDVPCFRGLKSVCVSPSFPRPCWGASVQWTPSLHTVDKVELIMPISDLSQDLLKLLNCFKIQIDIHAGGIWGLLFCRLLSRRHLWLPRGQWWLPTQCLGHGLETMGDRNLVLHLNKTMASPWRSVIQCVNCFTILSTDW